MRLVAACWRHRSGASSRAGELAETIEAAREPCRTLFRLASVVGARKGDLLGLWWQDLALADLDAATIRFGFQSGLDGERVQLKTDESRATLPLPRSTAVLLLEHKARTPAPTSPRSFVFATRTGRPLHKDTVLRALYRPQEHARDARGLPTLPELFELDERGELVVGADGEFVLAPAHQRSQIGAVKMQSVRTGRRPPRSGALDGAERRS